MTAGQQPVADQNDPQAALRARLLEPPSDARPGQPQGPAVVVTSIKIPFGDMVAICFKWFFAMLVVAVVMAIPVAIIYAMMSS